MRKTHKPGKKILPGIWKLNQDTFVVRAQPIDPRTGKKKNRKRLLEGVTLQEAMREREALLVFEDRTRKTSTRPETVADFAAWWLGYKNSRGDLGPATAQRYARSLDHLSKRILELPLKEVSAGVIEAWMVEGVRGPGGPNGAGFHPDTINGWLRVLGTLFKDACRLRGLTSNPMDGVRPLPVPVDLEEKNSLPFEQLLAVMHELRKGDPCVAMAGWVQALTGLRWGEVAALKWEDLDGDRVLRVQRTFVNGQLLPLTKTKRARRVGIPEPLLGELERHRAWLEAEKHPGLELGLMFPSTVGKPIWSARISEELRAVGARLQLKRRFTSHGFRRSFNDLLREAAVDPVVCKAITGHSTDRMREHYSTVRSAHVVAAGDAAAALFGPGLRLIQGGKESSEESSDPAGTTTAS